MTMWQTAEFADRRTRETDVHKAQLAKEIKQQQSSVSGTELHKMFLLLKRYIIEQRRHQ